MRKNIKFLITILFLIQNSFYSQNKPESRDASHYLSQITPASPDALKLGSYGNVPVGLFTGTSNVNVPLLSYSVGNIKIPITLNYSSNGVKIDDTNGSVGLTWSLIAGGAVTRAVRGIADELETTGLEVFPNIDELGVLDPTVVNYIRDGELGLIDTEPDLYTASFLGNSMKFVFDKNGQPIIFSQKNYRIGGGGLEIITDDGTKYNFDAEENIQSRTFGGEKSKVTFATNSWYLTKITDVNNNIIFIEYEDNHYKHIISRSQTMLFTTPGAIQSYYSPQGILTPFNIREDIGPIINYEQDIKGKVIKKFYSNDTSFGSVEFDYDQVSDLSESKHLTTVRLKKQNDVIKEFQFVYDVTSSKRRFLREVKDVKSNTMHSFEYYNQNSLPSRLDFSRDIYGYYNAKTNPSKLIPNIEEGLLEDIDYVGADQNVDTSVDSYGLLKKINYPTKGSSELFYEPNGFLYKGMKDTYSTEVLGLYSIRDNFNNGELDSIEWIAQKSERIKIILGVAFTGDEGCSTFDNGSQTADFYARDENGATLNLLQYNSAQGTYTGYVGNTIRMGTTTLFLNVIQGQKISFILDANKHCCTSTANIYTTKVNEIYVEEWRSLGGSRIAKTIDDSKYSPPVIREYKYEDESGKPSYHEIRKPYFIDTNYNRYYQFNEAGSPTGFFKDVRFYTLTSSNLHFLNSLHPNLFYDTVIESTPDKGSMVHKYNIDTDWYGNQLIGNTINSAPWSNYGWEIGKELNTIFRDNDNNKQKEILYKYKQDSTKVRKVQGLSIRKKYAVQGGDVNVILNCNSSNINTVYWYYYCDANHQHYWDLFSGKCQAMGHIDSWRKFTGPCYNKPGQQIVFDGNLDNLDVMLYDNVSYFDYLESQITTDYKNGTPLITTTEYFYNNPNHYQLTGQQTIFPDGSDQIMNYKYAHEKDKTLMIEKNMVGIPLETSTTKGSKLLSKTLTDYPDVLPDTQTGNLLLPRSISSLDLITGNMSTEVTYNQYDSKGNLQQYTTRSGIPTAVVWGYNDTQPIAKIEGATYSQISSAASAIVSASDSDASAGINNDESSLLNLMKVFSEALPNYQVTTYTYDPLVGVRSITPPNGIRQVYIYDTANRLKEVRENSQTGNLLKEYQYNYKH